MRDSALKPAVMTLLLNMVFSVGEELMRDSALKPVALERAEQHAIDVGEELMRDSALKLLAGYPLSCDRLRRRRAHARQRFETPRPTSTERRCAPRRRRAHARQRFETRCGRSSARCSNESEKSSCATAL